jgi:small conductance mechanosensitive channel
MEFEWSLEYLKYVLDARVMPFAVNLVVASLIFIVGRWLARALKRAFSRYVGQRLDASLARFASSMIYALLLAIVTIAALERIGVKTTAAIAVLGAAGLAIGLALQGSLANFAAGCC